MKHHPSVGSRRLIGVFGNSGTGKTVTLRALIRQWNRRLCFDRSAELQPGIDVEEVAHSRDEVADYLRGLSDEEEFSLAYQPGIMKLEEEAAECGFLARLALAAGNCVFSVDEASRSCRQNLVDPATVQIALEGRKLGVSGIYAAQRVVHVDTDIRGEAFSSEVYVYRLARRADRREIEEEHGPELAEEVKKFENLRGVHIVNGSGGALIYDVKVVPDNTTPILEETRR